MRLKTFTLSLLGGAVGLFTFSCQQEIPEVKTSLSLQVEQQSHLLLEETLLSIREKAQAYANSDCQREVLRQHLVLAAAQPAVAPSACSGTELKKTITRYAQAFGPLEQQFYESYVAVNQLAAVLDTDDQYFGAEGEHTQLVEKQKKSLEKFWDMPDQIRIKGQHNTNLDNRDKIAGVYMVFTNVPASLAYAVADQLISINNLSPIFVETPLLTYDAFATTDKMIVLGDGLIQLLTESGVETDIALSGVLAHEWGHQVQFNHFKSWYGVEPKNYPKTPASTRLMELEADFFTGYYVTHQKGGTKNWKKAAEFFELFYNLGECNFDSNSHHGTPNQRMAAARLGYLASLATLQANLSADEAHALFRAAYNAIIENNTDYATILAGLKGPNLKSVYARMLKHENEVKGILQGKLNKDQISNLKD